MRWFIPSWSGDFRLEDKDGHAVLRIDKPTQQERVLLTLFLTDAFDNEWLAEPTELGGEDVTEIRFTVDLATLGPAFVARLSPQDRTLTAVKFQDGHLEVAEHATLGKLARKAKKQEAVAAVSVKRATPSCPQCIPGAVLPASEVLLEFLDEQQHRDWAKYRALTVMGNASGHTYLIAHRHSPFAQRLGRIAFDVSDQAIMHFYDWTVPPEEEVLGAMLILQSREHWLRNEATKMRGHRFKNPFGGKYEGYEESIILSALGRAAERLGVSGSLR